MKEATLVNHHAAAQPAAGRLRAGVCYRSPLLTGLGVNRLLPSERQRQLLWAFLLIGLVARCVRYLACFPLWEDECFLCSNFIERGYLDLLQPLEYHQVAPPLFLWLELTVVKLLGFTEWSLRLVPFLCSVASLFAFRHLAGRLLKGPALLLAVAMFALAYPGVRYAAEAKQYSFDLLMSLLLLTLVVEWWRRPKQVGWLWGLAALVPLALGLSYPALFVAGGVSLATALVLWTTGDKRGWIAWTAYNVLLVGTFGGLFLAVARGQSAADLDFMRECWKGAFPPLSTPLRLPLWLLQAHTSELFAWPAGSAAGGSTLTFLACAAGVTVLVRRRQWTFLVLGLAPAVLHLLAATLQRYPYGGHVKFGQHLGPAICLLGGVGTAAVLGRLAARPRTARLALAFSLLFPLSIGLGVIVRDVLQPFKTRSDMRARAFASWFWFNSEFDSETVCVKTDLHQNFAPKTWTELSWSAMYLCNQRIYSPRHAAGTPPRYDLVSAAHPLRCVLYRDMEFPFDQAAFEHWLLDMQTHYRLASRQTYAFPRYDHREQKLLKTDYLDLFQLVPRTAPSESSPRVVASSALSPLPLAQVTHGPTLRPTEKD